MKKTPWWLSAGLVAGTFGLLYYLERRRPLRKPVEPELQHVGRNLAIATIAAATVRVAEQPATAWATDLVERRQWGLLKKIKLPRKLELALAVALLDYTLYIWHILVHKVPALWRFHQAHHVDLDMDTTTAVRFHFAELVVSVPWRVLQVLVIGASPQALSTWQTATLLEIMFHHSNVELPPRLEQWLSKLIVTPRLHTIHHSIVRGETDSNWSSGLTVWDWLHGTLRRDVPADDVVIGVPAYRDPAELTLPRVLELPFGEQRPSWQPADEISDARPHEAHSVQGR